MLIAPIPYQSEWSGRFVVAAKALEKAFDEAAIRIDHIGSTSVVGLVAKPVIDVQVTVGSLPLSSNVIVRLSEQGFIQKSGIGDDRPPPWEQPSSEEWRKAYFKSTDGANGRVQVHVRELGRRNQRYALLFRDYLRANDRARDAYGAFKLQIAEMVGHLSQPGGTGAYLDLKDPVFDLIADSAEKWAEASNWSVDSDADV